MEKIKAKDSEAWRAWLEENSKEVKEVKLIYFKKATGKPSVSYEESVEEALCFGWIDGVRHAIDEESYSVRFTPRNIKSIWSQVNKNRVAKLISEGKMKPEGLKLIEIAIKNGHWDKAYSMKTENEIPEDLNEAMLNNPKAFEFFQTLSPSNKFICIYRIIKLKTPELRQERILKFITLLEKKIKPNEW